MNRFLLTLMLLFTVLTVPKIPALKAQVFTSTQTATGDPANSTLTSPIDSGTQQTTLVETTNSSQTPDPANSQTSTISSSSTPVSVSTVESNVTQPTVASSTTISSVSQTSSNTTTSTSENTTAFVGGNGESNSTTTVITSTTTYSSIITQSSSTSSDTSFTTAQTDPLNWVLITVSSNPAGSSSAVTVDGLAITTPHTFNWTLGSSHLLNANLTFTCGTGCQYYFSSWSDGGGQAHTITANNNETITARFSQQYYLTTNASPNNGGTVTPLSGWFNSGAQVTIHAFTASGYLFTSWTCAGTGCFGGSSSSTTITMNSPVLELANFQQISSGYSATFRQYGLPPGVIWSILVNGNYYITSSNSITVTGLSGTINYAYQGLTFGNYFYNQYYYLSCYQYQNYCYDSYWNYNQYFNSYSNDNPMYLNEYVCVYGCFGSISGATATTSGYVFYQTVNQQAPASTYTVSFQEYGLPGGYTWWVTVGGHIYSTSTNSITVYGVSSGTSYNIQNSPPGYVCQSNCSGTLTGPTTIAINYSGGSYTVTITTQSPIPEFSGTTTTILLILSMSIGVLFANRRRHRDNTESRTLEQGSLSVGEPTRECSG